MVNNHKGNVQLQSISSYMCTTTVWDFKPANHRESTVLFESVPTQCQCSCHAQWGLKSRKKISMYTLMHSKAGSIAGSSAEVHYCDKHYYVVRLREEQTLLLIQLLLLDLLCSARGKYDLT